MTKHQLSDIIAINENTPRGEMTTAVLLDYGTKLSEASVTVDTFQVRDRKITDVSEDSDYRIRLTLAPDFEHGLTREMIGFGPDTKTKVTGPKIFLRQVRSIETKEGETIEAFSDERRITKSVNAVTDRFKEHHFTDKDGKTLTYHLFRPDQAAPDARLPLVVFLHDSSVCSADSTAALIQGIGGTIWAENEEQKVRPAYVLVPQYPEKTAFDDYTVSDQCERTVKLIEELLSDDALFIDRTRVYGTGQSMGGMMLFEIASTHPALFTAEFYVACQWDPMKVGRMTDRRMWILISEKDERAFPILSEGLANLEASGGHISRGNLDAKSDVVEQEAFATKVLSQNANIQFTYFTGSSVVPPGAPEFPGCYHLFTWLWAYGIEPIRAWLFAQVKKGE